MPSITFRVIILFSIVLDLVLFFCKETLTTTLEAFELNMLCVTTAMTSPIVTTVGIDSDIDLIANVNVLECIGPVLLL